MRRTEYAGIKRVIAGVIAAAVLCGCGKKAPEKVHTLMFTMESENWGCNDRSEDFIASSEWSVYYDGEVEFYNNYNISGKSDESNWTLTDEKREDLINILSNGYKRYVENYNASDGTGWHMKSYNERGEVEHEFDGYIYDNVTLEEIVEILEPDSKEK